MDIASLEQKRTALQDRCDQQRSQSERNRLGQFATPFALAREIIEASLTYFPKDEPLRFLDPAFGTGAFYSALLHACPGRVVSAVGYEIDKHYGSPAHDLWAPTRLHLQLEDFTRAKGEGAHINFLACNPPYVRHHHLSLAEKMRLREASLRAGVKLSGLAGLYCHFMVLSHGWLSPNAVSSWLIPSEFMDVNYGEAIKRYLTTRVNLLRIHRFDPQALQFADALVSSAIVWFRNEVPSANTEIQISFGASVAEPAESIGISLKEVKAQPKWTRLVPSRHRQRASASASVRIGDLFQIKRGLVTGDNGFFILSAEQVEQFGISHRFLKPVLPSPRYLPQDVIRADSDGSPLLEKRLFLIDCPLYDAELLKADPALAQYLEAGKRTVAQGYICRTRTPWYSQEYRPPAPFLCTYMARVSEKRERAFRFILNHSTATAPNVYLLMYPRPVFRDAITEPATAMRVFELLKRIPLNLLTAEGRVYGGGLYKLEPAELANVPADEIASVLNSELISGVQMSLVHE